MSPETVARLFTRSDGSYRFARWARPLAPVVFGTDDASLTPLKDAIRETAALADLPVVDADPELGANLVVFFVREWAELLDVPDLDRLIPDLAPLVDRLGQAGANQYRSFRFEGGGAIKLCAIFLHYDDDLAAVDAHTLAVAQTVQSLLLWSDTAFRDRGPVARLAEGGRTIVRPEIAALIRAAYDPVMPAAAQDPSHAHRLAARAGLLLGDLA